MTQYLELIIPAGVFAIIILFLYVRIMRNRVPWWAASINKRNAWNSKGSVYFAHCWEIPGIGKVGVTQRTTITKRMKEIQSKMTGYPVKLYFAIDYIPFSWAVEQEAHRLLKKRRVVFPKGSPLGHEWFACANDAEVQEIVDGVTEAAVVGYPHDTKGQGIHAFVVAAPSVARAALDAAIRKDIGAHARIDRLQIVPGLPKTRSGKVMRRILRKIAEAGGNDPGDLGDLTTLADPGVVEAIKQGTPT